MGLFARLRHGFSKFRETSDIKNWNREQLNAWMEKHQAGPGQKFKGGLTARSRADAVKQRLMDLGKKITPEKQEDIEASQSILAREWEGFEYENPLAADEGDESSHVEDMDSDIFEDPEKVDSENLSAFTQHYRRPS